MENFQLLQNKVVKKKFNNKLRTYRQVIIKVKAKKQIVILIIITFVLKLQNPKLKYLKHLKLIRELFKKVIQSPFKIQF